MFSTTWKVGLVSGDIVGSLVYNILASGKSKGVTLVLGKSSADEKINSSGCCEEMKDKKRLFFFWWCVKERASVSCF